MEIPISQLELRVQRLNALNAEVRDDMNQKLEPKFSTEKRKSICTRFNVEYQEA